MSEMQNERYVRILAFYIDKPVYLAVTEEVNGYGVFLVLGTVDSVLVKWFLNRDSAIEFAVKVQPKSNDVIRSALTERVLTYPRFSWE